MVIFHSYVKLPEGKSLYTNNGTPLGLDSLDPHRLSEVPSDSKGKKLGYLDFKDFSALVTLQAAHVASR